jgi:predicted acetyltransferase
MELVWPEPAYLRSYREALQRGWSPNNSREEAGAEELAAIAKDPDSFLRQLVDLEGVGEVKLPDGSVVPRLPSFRQWMWDGEFCGSIALRWHPSGTLPPYCLGHVGYAVVPWKQRRGYATRALALVIAQARARALRYVEITTSPANVASQKVIMRNGGVLIEEFEKLPSLGGGPERRYRIVFVAPDGRLRP